MMPRTCLICLEEFENEPAAAIANGVDLELGRERQEAGNTDAAAAAADAADSLSPPSCSHFFCQPCLREHIQHAVETKQVPIVCPELLCTVPLEHERIRDLFLSDIGGEKKQEQEDNDDGEVPTLLGRWQRLQTLAENKPFLVECPACDALVDVRRRQAEFGDSDPEENGPAAALSPTAAVLLNDDLACDGCHRTFCRVHGDSHSGQTCREFLASDEGRRLRQTERVLDRCTEPCSHCSARLHKQTGCDYVVCAHCHGDMCYKCGTHEHLTTGRFRHCAQCGGLFDGRLDFACWMICLMVVVWILVLLVYPPLALVAVLLTGCCCGCFRLGYGLNSAERELDPRRGAAAVLVVVFVPWVLTLFGDDGMAALPDSWSSSNDDGNNTRRYIRAHDLPVMRVTTNKNMNDGTTDRTADATEHANDTMNDSSDIELGVVTRANDNHAQGF